MTRATIDYDEEAASVNGTCDQCGAPIVDNLDHRPAGLCDPARICSRNWRHDPYSDGYANGGDPDRRGEWER